MSPVGSTLPCDGCEITSKARFHAHWDSLWALIRGKIILGSTLPCILSPHCIERHLQWDACSILPPISRSNQPWRLSKPWELHRTLHGTFRPVFKRSGSTLQCIICVYSEHSNMQVKHTGSTLPSCLNTLRALYEAVWTTLGALHRIYTDWEHSRISCRLCTACGTHRHFEHA